MGTGSPDFRENVTIRPILVVIIILGVIAVVVSDLVPNTSAISSTLLAQASYAANAETLDQKCTDNYSYACNYPYYDTHTGDPCGVNRKVISNQVVGHCVKEHEAKADCEYLEGESGCKPIQGTTQIGTAAPGAAYTGSFYPVSTDSNLPSLNTTASINTFGAPSAGNISPDASPLSPTASYGQTFSPPVDQVAPQGSMPSTDSGSAMQTSNDSYDSVSLQATPGGFVPMYRPLDDAQLGGLTAPVPSDNGVNAFGDTQIVQTYDQPVSFDSATTFQQYGATDQPNAPAWYQVQAAVDTQLTPSGLPADGQSGGRVFDSFGQLPGGLSLDTAGNFQVTPTSSVIPDWLGPASNIMGNTPAQFVTDNIVNDESLYSNLQNIPRADNSALLTGLDNIVLDTYENNFWTPPTNPAYEAVYEWNSAMSSGLQQTQQLNDEVLGGGWADFRKSDNVIDERNASGFETTAYAQADQQIISVPWELNQAKSAYANADTYWSDFYTKVGIPAESVVTQDVNSFNGAVTNSWSYIKSLF